MEKSAEEFIFNSIKPTFARDSENFHFSLKSFGKFHVADIYIRYTLSTFVIKRLASAKLWEPQN